MSQTADSSASPALTIPVGTAIIFRFVRMTGDLLVIYDRASQEMLLNVEASWMDLHRACVRELTRSGYEPGSAAECCAVLPLPRLWQA